MFEPFFQMNLQFKAMIYLGYEAFCIQVWDSAWRDWREADHLGTVDTFFPFLYESGLKAVF